MSVKHLSRSLKVRSQSQIPIVRSARMSSPPSSARPTKPTCDGAPSHWAAVVRPAPRPSHTTGRARIVVATLSRCRPTQAAQRPRSTASDSAGRIGSHRQHYAAIFRDRHGRGVEPGNRQGDGFRGAVERRAARGHRETAAQSGDWIPQRAPTQLVFLALAVRK